MSESPFGGVDLQIMLADYAQENNGKLTVVGAGWTIQHQPAPFAIAGFLQVPWSHKGEEIAVSFELHTFDGEPVVLPGADAPLEVGMTVAALAGAQTKPGEALSVPIAMNSGPLPLEPGRYTWRVSVNGKGKTRWSLPFELQTGMLVN